MEHPLSIRLAPPLERNGVSSSFGFRIRSEEPLRFARFGGGREELEVVVAAERRKRPASAPLAEWSLAGPARGVRGTLYQMKRGFELWVTDAGAYRIDPEAGRIEMPENHDAILREQRLWGIPAALCFMHRGDIPLHAAAVETDAGAIVLAAPRRHGKTTLALAFRRCGYRVLSEDVACCRPGAAPALLPGPALLRPRPDVYNGDPPAGTHLVAARSGRIYLAEDDDRKGSSAPVPIVAILLLRESEDDIMLERMPASAAIPDLWRVSLRIPTDEARARLFTQLTRLAGALPIWNLYRPLRLASLDATVARIVETCCP